MAGEEFTEDQAKVVDQLLLQAVESADGSRIDLCLRKGADIDARNGQGRTPLMLAIWHENPNLTEFILARKPSLFLKDNGGKSAFDHIADVRDGAKRTTITNVMLRALPDHVRKRGGTIAEAATRAEAEVKDVVVNDNVATAADITVSKPLSLPPRQNPKGFSL